MFVKQYDYHNMNHGHVLPDGVQPGTPEAKAWWAEHVDAKLHSAVTPEMKAKYGSKVIGAYKGKPLVPGEIGKGQGDFQYIHDKMVNVHGMESEVASKILGKHAARMNTGMSEEGPESNEGAAED